VTDLRPVLRLGRWAQAHCFDAPLVPVDGAPEALLADAKRALGGTSLLDLAAGVGALVLDGIESRPGRKFVISISLEGG